ncbi:metal ABC transporter permease [Roseococcus sp. SDR]|uniref:metal ABC transporter permease n=1 Tax=Roseococcus sp. SDR TaxID=2835532 RepID=UPI001BD181E5|nr:metal ABC transporter permease [Roseococcus sp. SDR]MBS7790217.1 metal ABC transporter permease [Roseococcus sp. SDR]MBV1845531.1 metal ABC transporter permease [Roseococcus sp. SDR]
MIGHNTLIVLLGCAALGAASGVVGSFALLRGRALLADAIGHAALPGVVAASLLMAALGGPARSLAPLLLGAAISAWLGLLALRALTASGRIRQDAAIGVVLSAFYALGTVGLSIAQAMPEAAQAGLSHFILGQAATMTEGDALLAGGLALSCIAVIAALFQPLRALCFDEGFARSQGLPVRALDLALLGLLLAVCVAGLPAVGLLLVVALLIVPAAAARLVTRGLPSMVALAGALGAAAGASGALISTRFDHIPTGAAVVLAGLLGFAAAVAFRRR